MKTNSLFLHPSIHLDPEAITKAIFRGRKIDQVWEERVQAVVRSVEATLRPEAVGRWLSVVTIGEERVIFIDPVTQQTFAVQMGEHVAELHSAHMVLCCVATLGAQFDDTLQQWTRSGEILDGYLADCVGIYGLLQVSRAVYREVEARARQNSWGVGRVLCPGAIEGWILEQQQAFCTLLPLEQLGVTVNDCGGLSPARSVSFLIGIGPGYTACSVDSPCNICTNTGECWCKC